MIIAIVPSRRFTGAFGATVVYDDNRVRIYKRFCDDGYDRRCRTVSRNNAKNALRFGNGYLRKPYIDFIRFEHPLLLDISNAAQAKIASGQSRLTLLRYLKGSRSTPSPPTIMLM
jgi:hypothetical protein